MGIFPLKNSGKIHTGKEVVAIFTLRKPGSITVFLTMIFLLFFSAVGVTYDCTRIHASHGYMKVAGSSAAQTVFGAYNRELFEEYGLFGYGGYDGKGEEDLNREFLQILEENLQTSGEKVPTYIRSNIYQVENLKSYIKERKNLTEQEIFYRQIADFLQHRAVSELTDNVWKKISNTTSETELEKKLAFAEKYENGEYDQIEENDTEEVKETGEDLKDTAGGNPLETFSHMIREGVLGMVCQERELSEKEISPRESQKEEGVEEDYAQTGASNYLKQFMKRENPLPDRKEVSKGKNKMLLLAYCREVCPNYLSKEKEGIQYALEYLAAGRKEEKSNLLSIVNRLLAIRTLLNFTYVVSEPVLQEKSLATATALAGFTGLPPVITGVQYTILLILSFQEACIDVTALLDGKVVPIIKNVSNFKMKYEEICIASKGLFQKKAKTYQAKKLENGFQISYEEYLTVFMLLTGEATLRNRTLDVIQQNLREKYNQSFCIDDCICEGTYQLSYEMDYIFKELPFLEKTPWGQSVGEQCQEVSYGYKSG